MIDIEYKSLLKDLGKFSIYVNKDDKGISKTLYKYDFKSQWPREPEFMHLFHKKISKSTKIIDLGANIGYLTLYFKKVLGVKEKILAIEPDITNFSFLKKNLELNRIENEVVYKNIAISNYDGFANLQLSGHSNLHKITSKKTSDKVICKKLTTLLLEESFQPDFIKMDVEGAEIEVVSGFREYIKQNKNKLSILFEVHPNDYSENRNFNEQLNFLFSNGFYTESLITAGTYFPQFFIERGYSSSISFKSGKFNRHIIDDVKNEDVINALNNQAYFKEKNNLSAIFKTLKLYSNSKKIVRGLLLTRP